MQHIAKFAVTLCLLLTVLAGNAAAQHMYEGHTMALNQVRYSPNGQFRIQWTCSGVNCSLLQYQNISGTWVARAYIFDMVISALHQPRVEMYFGNWVVLDSGGGAHAMSDTFTGLENWLGIQDDGNIVVYDLATSTPLWTPRCEFPTWSTYATMFPFDLANCPQ